MAQRGRLARGLFSRSDVERQFGWNPQGGHNRQWVKLLDAAHIPDDERTGPFTEQQVRRILKAFYLWQGRREEKRLLREFREAQKRAATPSEPPGPSTSPSQAAE